MILTGDTLFAVDPSVGLPIVFRTYDGARGHLGCLEPHVRERCSLLVLRVERVEGVAEMPTMPDGGSSDG